MAGRLILDFLGHIRYDINDLADVTATPVPVTHSLAGDLPSESTARIGVTLHWLFRLGILMEFLGHGLAGLSLKEGWIRYFAVFGFDRPAILTLMPIVGTIDISLGILGFVSPRRWALVWCAFWGLMTATLRPLAGESFWEILDRAGNFGGPLAFLVLSGLPRTARAWIDPIRVGPVSRDTLKRVAVVLQWITALVLIGHGAYGALLQKRQLVDMYTKAGLGARLLPVVGWCEIALGIAIAVKPFRTLLLAACVYKIATELLYPMTGYPVYEFVERGFTYVAPLALFFLLPHLNDPPEKGAPDG
jgi:hypothetical protein